jgi:hypothetical protein
MIAVAIATILVSGAGRIYQFEVASTLKHNSHNQRRILFPCVALPEKVEDGGVGAQPRWILSLNRSSGY